MCIRDSYEGVKLGYLGEVHPEVADNYKIGERVYVAVLDMPAVVPFVSFDWKYAVSYTHLLLS